LFPKHGQTIEGLKRRPSNSVDLLVQFEIHINCSSGALSGAQATPLAEVEIKLISAISMLYNRIVGANSKAIVTAKAVSA
jgi:hypothetical protein